jgi:isocitrate lyase
MPNFNEQLSREQQIAALEKDWATNPRWKGIKRGYSAADVCVVRSLLSTPWHVVVLKSCGICCTLKITSTA